MASGGIVDVGPVFGWPLPAGFDDADDVVRRGGAERGDAELGVTDAGAAEPGAVGTGAVPGGDGTSAAYGVVFPLRVRPTADTTARTVNATTANRGRKDFATPSRRDPDAERLSFGTPNLSNCRLGVGHVSGGGRADHDVGLAAGRLLGSGAVFQQRFPVFRHGAPSV
jgi:hypothetical protein